MSIISGILKLLKGISTEPEVAGSAGPSAPKRPLAHWVTISIPLVASLMALALYIDNQPAFWGLFSLVGYSLTSTVSIERTPRLLRAEEERERPDDQRESPGRKKGKKHD